AHTETHVSPSPAADASDTAPLPMAEQFRAAQELSLDGNAAAATALLACYDRAATEEKIRQVRTSAILEFSRVLADFPDARATLAKRRDAAQSHLQSPGAIDWALDF